MSPFPSDGQPVYIGVSSFGIGGSYGHAILMPYVPLARYDISQRPAEQTTTTRVRYVYAKGSSDARGGQVLSNITSMPLLCRALPCRLPLRLPPASPSCTSSHYLLPLSAITQEHLERFEGLLADHLEQHPEVGRDAHVCPPHPPMSRFTADVLVMLIPGTSVWSDAPCLPAALSG